jgi:hypothetical protein
MSDETPDFDAQAHTMAMNWNGPLPTRRAIAAILRLAHANARLLLRAPLGELFREELQAAGVRVAPDRISSESRPATFGQDPQEVAVALAFERGRLDAYEDIVAMEKEDPDTCWGHAQIMVDGIREVMARMPPQAPAPEATQRALSEAACCPVITHSRGMGRVEEAIMAALREMADRHPDATDAQVVDAMATIHAPMGEIRAALRAPSPPPASVDALTRAEWYTIGDALFTQIEQNRRDGMSDHSPSSDACFKLRRKVDALLARLGGAA